MIKLLIVAGLLATIYFWYRGQVLLTARRTAELEEERRQRRRSPVDVEAEILDAGGKKIKR